MLRFTSCQTPSADAGFATLVTYIGNQLNIDTECVCLSSWEKREDLFLAGAVDVAWVCGWQYVLWNEQEKPFVPLVAPVALGERYGNRPIYFSDIVINTHTPATSISDLTSPIWSINEQLSWSGYRVAQHYLEQHNLSWDFVSEIYKAGSHESSVAAILSGRADIAAIDSTVLETMLRADPALADSIRVIDTTAPSGRPPYIVHPTLSKSLRLELLDVLTSLKDTDAGQAVLAKMGAQRLSAVSDTNYNSMRHMTGLPLK